MENIIFIGMPGCGKSTIGIVMAKILNMGFCDTDILIQQKFGKTLQQIIDEEGTEAFLKKEEEVLSAIECENILVATGGSAVMSEKAMRRLKSLGRVVYLKVPLKALKSRVKNQESRGIAFADGQTYDDIFALRTPLYEKYADITVNCTGKREKILSELTKILKG